MTSKDPPQAISAVQPAPDLSNENDLLQIDYSDQIGFQHQVLWAKMRVQIPLIMAIALAVQLVAAELFFEQGGTQNSTITSIVATALANLASLINYRRLRLFPGSRRLAFLLPAFLAPYGFVIIMLLWLRPAYSVSLLAVGAFTAIVLAWIFNALSRNPNSFPLFILPSKKTSEMLFELPHLHHRWCETPEELLSKRATIVADLREELDPQWERALAGAALKGSTIYHAKHVWESLSGRVKIDHLSENSFGTLMPNSFYFAIKDVADRLTGVAGLIIAMPIILAASMAIIIETRGRPLFLQERVGFRGEVFTIFKLRTMVVDHENTDEREAAITKAGDPRITNVGKFLRITRIDELPQLWNMAKGELSLIGPRPEAVTLSKWYESEIDFYSYRHVVKPGITGWAQVNQGHVASERAVYRKLQYDFYYVKNFSLWIDLFILFKTAGVVLFGRGAK